MVVDVDVLTQVAADLRRRAGQIEPLFSTRKIIDACFPRLIVTGRELPAGIHEAVSRTADGEVLIYSRALPTAAKRFAIAHGLAHLLFDDSVSGCRVGYVGDPHVEARADSFAEELLVPLKMLREYVERQPPANDNSTEREFYLDQVDEIASHFHVPSHVIDKRIREMISHGMFS